MFPWLSNDSPLIEEDRRVSLTGMKGEKPLENSAHESNIFILSQETRTKKDTFFENHRKSDIACSSRSSVTYSVRSANQGHQEESIKTQDSVIPPHGTLVHLYSLENMQLLAARCTNDVWYLDNEEIEDTSNPATQFILLRMKGYVGFRSCLANGSLLQCNHKNELRFTNPKFELWERWQYETNGIRNVKFKNVFLPLEIVPFSVKNRQKQEILEDLQQYQRALEYSQSRQNCLQEELNNIYEDNKKLRKATQDLDEEKQNLLDDNKKKMRELKSLQLQIEKLESSYHRTSLNYNSSLEHIHTLQNKVDELEKRCELLEKESQEKDNLLQMWSERCKAEEEYKSDLSRRLQVKEDQLAELETEVLNMKEQLKSKERLLVAAQKNLRSLRETLSNVQISEKEKQERKFDVQTDNSKASETTDKSFQ
eukprot:jgi/Galph1/3449/GphlegSOOS_G2094.1